MKTPWRESFLFDRRSGQVVSAEVAGIETVEAMREAWRLGYTGPFASMFDAKIAPSLSESARIALKKKVDWNPVDSRLPKRVRK